MINRLPISTERLSFVFIEAAVKADFESGAQKLNRDGDPQWRVTLLVTSDEFKAETCDCTIASKTEPSFPAMSYVQLEKPVAVLWQQGERAGLAISATSIRPANAPKAPASNGAAEKVPATA